MITHTPDTTHVLRVEDAANEESTGIIQMLIDAVFAIIRLPLDLFNWVFSCGGDPETIETAGEQSPNKAPITIQKPILVPNVPAPERLVSLAQAGRTDYVFNETLTMEDFNEAYNELQGSFEVRCIIKELSILAKYFTNNEEVMDKIVAISTLFIDETFNPDDDEWLEGPETLAPIFDLPLSTETKNRFIFLLTKTNITQDIKEQIFDQLLLVDFKEMNQEAIHELIYAIYFLKLDSDYLQRAIDQWTEGLDNLTELDIVNFCALAYVGHINLPQNVLLEIDVSNDKADQYKYMREVHNLDEGIQKAPFMVVQFYKQKCEDPKNRVINRFIMKRSFQELDAAMREIINRGYDTKNILTLLKCKAPKSEPNKQKRYQYWYNTIHQTDDVNNEEEAKVQETFEKNKSFLEKAANDIYKKLKRKK